MVAEARAAVAPSIPERPAFGSSLTSLPCVAESSTPAEDEETSWSAEEGPSETVMLPAIKEVKQTTNLPAQTKSNSLNLRGFLLFDIDGVLRDVANSYRLAIQETVNHFCDWRPTIQDIDELKSEGGWNNDWKASQEMIRRCQSKNNLAYQTPEFEEIIQVFSDFYFGGDPNGDSRQWEGFIKNEPLLVERGFFEKLTSKGFEWGFISGAEPPSAKYVLETRLRLQNPPLIAMGDAPDKPDPTGLLYLARQLAGVPLGQGVPPIAYLGDTVADVKTIQQARIKVPSQIFISLAVAPPHLHNKKHKQMRLNYEKQLREAGADIIIKSTSEVLDFSGDST